MSQLNGRVFTRLQQYDALPAELKREVESLEEYLYSIQTELFGMHRTMTLKSVHGVRTRPLLEKIEAWVKQHGSTGATTTTSAGHTSKAATLEDKLKDVKDHVTGNDHGHHASSTPATTNVGNYQTATSGVPGLAPVPMVKPTDPSVGAHIPKAKKLLDALVLKGFVTPYKEDKPDELQSATEDIELSDSDLLVSVSKRITTAASEATTVWDLVDGAVFADMVKRKAGLLEPLTHGKDEYAIVNGRTKNLTLFSTDLGREPVLQLAADSLKVSFDKSHYENGVKVWNESGAELLNLATQQESDALVHALLAIGATHDNANGTPVKTVTDKIREEVKEATTTHTSGDVGNIATSGVKNNDNLDTHTEYNSVNQIMHPEDQGQFGVKADGRVPHDTKFPRGGEVSGQPNHVAP